MNRLANLSNIDARGNPFHPSPSTSLKAISFSRKWMVAAANLNNFLRS